MKFKNILLLLILAILWSCGENGEDPDVTPDQEDEIAAFGVFSEENLVDGVSFLAVPEGLSNASDPCGLEAAFYVTALNGLQIYSIYWVINYDGSTSSSSPLEPVSGHSNYRVYEYGDFTGGFVAIQFSQGSNRRHYKVFAKTAEDEDYFKFIDSWENLESTEGAMDIYSEPDDLITESMLQTTYTWKINSDNSREVQFTDYNLDGISERVTVLNNADLSGNLVYEYSSGKRKETVWDSNGSGSWKEFDEDGNLEDEGSWTIE